MDKQITIFGISDTAWSALGVMALLILILLAFMLDVGPDLL